MRNGVIRSQVHYQPCTDELIHVTSQPTEDLIYAENAEFRKDNAYGELEWGRQVASIPFIAWEKAIRDGYALNAPDSEIAEKELFRFLRSDEGKICMVRDKL